MIACSYELQNELSNEKRFQKIVTGGLVQVRNGLGDGLFTVGRPLCILQLWPYLKASWQAYNHEENWGIARQ